MASQYPSVKIFSDYESALATAVDGIVIATPAGSHYDLALSALQAGKDVFVEKPMTLKTSQAEELARYADQQGLILMVGHLLLYQSAIAKKTVDGQLNNQDQGSWQAEIESTQPLQQECQHFLDCLQNRQQPRSNGWNGVAVVNILEKVQSNFNF